MKLNEVNIVNRRARFDYEISETFTAGIVLTGTEIKSIRLGKAGLSDTFCLVSNGEVWVKNMYVAEYFYGSYNNHSARRDRKLLLKKEGDSEAGQGRQGCRFHGGASEGVYQWQGACQDGGGDRTR